MALWSMSTSDPVSRKELKEAIKGTPPAYPEGIGKSYDRIKTAAINAAASLADKLGTPKDSFYVNIYGHIHPDHLPYGMEPNEVVTVTVGVVPYVEPVEAESEPEEVTDSG